MKSYMKTWIAAVMALSLSSTASAAVIVRPVYIGSFNATFASLGQIDLTNPTDPDFANFIHQFDVTVEVTDLPEGVDFGGVNFNVAFGTGVTASSFGWFPTNGEFTVGSFPFTRNLALWITNEDAGNEDTDPGSTTDLQNIVAAATAEVADLRQYGESSRPKDGSEDTLGFPTKIGHFFAHWDPSQAAATELRIQPVAVEPWLTFVNNNTGDGTSQAQDDGFIGESFQFGVIPEPGSAAMLVLGSLGLLARRRVA